ncbi:tetratricopeptide repeat protein [Trichocoleus sp. ST-U3]|uniref:tetratricopeptide repeat protein n=1 Tax=Coleofasciculus sp. FACHB-542 TaxID=2692787 RepID=UPI0016849943|nr:tetratricopeptide repeat protein [Coleofasciculus sp. FACHB-542]MBD2086787.1 tetratricopeptide repeat protein [Coleofasciculus sp. FACHB-542]
MLEQLAEAFERKDYKTVAWLLNHLVKQMPQNPLVQFYVGRLYEETGKLEAAENAYRQLLRETTNPKIMTQARQGLGRIEAIAQQKRRDAIAQATAAPEDTEPGVLVLEAVSAEKKQVAAQQLARIVQIDPYTARLQLPSRGWRLYRTGPVGELRFYSQQMQQAEIPNFWANLADVRKLNVFRVSHFLSASPPSVVCENEHGQTGSLTFNWSEVRQQVQGLLPIFGEVIDQDARRQLQWKTQTQDYAQLIDLHLPSRHSILRLCDSNYQFGQGISFNPQPTQPNQATNRSHWNNLLHFLEGHLPQTPIWADFTDFAQTALDRTEILKSLKSHIDLFRREETLWDPAFQLYSGLVFLRGSKN